MSAWKHADSPRRSRGAACPQMWSALFALMLVACGTAAAAADAQAVAADEDPFASHVRPTDPLSPADEQAGFILPPGFIA